MEEPVASAFVDIAEQRRLENLISKTSFSIDFASPGPYINCDCLDLCLPRSPILLYISLIVDLFIPHASSNAEEIRLPPMLSSCPIDT